MAEPPVWVSPRCDGQARALPGPGTRRMRRRVPRTAIVSFRKLAMAGCAAMVVGSVLTHKWTPFAAVSIPPGVKTTFIPKGGKVAAPATNPKLKRLMETTEYRAFMDVLTRLKEEDELEEFFSNAEKYFDNVDVFGMAKASVNGKTRDNVVKLRSEWSQVWPRKLSNIGVDAFERILGFWNTLGQSKIADTIFQDVRASSGLLAKLSDEQHEELVGQILTDNRLVAEYRTLISDDADAQAVKPAVGRFVTSIVARFEKRLAGQAPEPAEWATPVVFGSLVALGVGIVMFATGVSLPPLPFSDEAPPPPPSMPIPERYSTTILKKALAGDLESVDSSLEAAQEQGLADGVFAYSSAEAPVEQRVEADSLEVLQEQRVAGGGSEIESLPE